MRDVTPVGTDPIDAFGERIGFEGRRVLFFHRLQVVLPPLARLLNSSWSVASISTITDAPAWN